MIVICINNDRYLHLTIDKEYDVISENEIYYEIKNDYGSIVDNIYRKIHFKKSRKEKLKRILE